LIREDNSHKATESNRLLTEFYNIHPDSPDTKLKEENEKLKKELDEKLKTIKIKE